MIPGQVRALENQGRRATNNEVFVLPRVHPRCQVGPSFVQRFVVRGQIVLNAPCRGWKQEQPRARGHWSREEGRDEQRRAGDGDEQEFAQLG